MNSEIFRYCTRALLPVVIFLSLFLLFRGHNHPGGGFIGGLAAAAATTLYYIAHQKMPAFFFEHWQTPLAIGVSLLLLDLILPLFWGKVLLTGMWWQWSVLGQPLTMGTPIIFDIGIYLLVLGSVILVVQFLEHK